MEQESGNSSEQPLLPRPPATTVAATPAQRRFWLLDRLVQRHGLLDPSLNVNVWQLRGALDIDSLSRAFTELVRRHEALRTALVVEGGQLTQVVTQAPASILDVVESDPAATSEDAARLIGRLIERETRQRFDLATGPLLRALLSPLAADRHLLVLATHYVAADGLAEGTLLGELGSLYAALTRGQALPPLGPLQYADFALWQRRWIDSLRDTQLTFWKQQLAGSPAALALPADRPRRNLPTFAGATRRFALDAAVADRLRTAAQGQGVTLYMMLLAALQAVLHCYSGQSDILVGTTVSDRPRPEAEPLVGSFSNNLLLRAQLSSEMPFSDLLAQVRRVAAEAYAHQSLPFEHLVDALQVHPDCDPAPLLRAMFVLHYHSLDDDLRLDGLVTQRVPIERGTATFDFYLRMASTTDSLTGSIEYSTDIFEPETIDRIIADLQNVLTAVADDVTRTVGTLPVSDLTTATDRAPLTDAIRQAASATPSRMPTSTAERVIAEAAAQAFGLPVALDDDFFDLGANSRQLLLLRMRLKDLGEGDITLAALFEHPTVRGLARLVTAEG